MINNLEAPNREMVLLVSSGIWFFSRWGNQEMYQEEHTMQGRCLSFHSLYVSCFMKIIVAVTKNLR